MDVAQNLKRYQLHAGGEAAAAIDLDASDLRPEDYKAFGIDSQVRPSNALLDLWFSNGNQRAIAYTHLYDVHFNPSEGLLLTFSEHLVTIRGYCLHELYRGLKRHRVVFIWEAAPQAARLAEEKQAVVSSIDVQPRGVLS